MGTRTALLDRVDRLGVEELTAKRLRERVLAALREVLAYDAHVWLLTDPVTRVGTSPLADVPGLPWSRLPELGRLRYLTRVNRWTDLMDARRRSALLLEATDGRPELSALWRNCLCDLGVVDVAAMVCYDRFGCWAWLDLWRREPAAPYTSVDAAFLADLSEVVTPLLRAAQARTFVDDAAGLDLSGPAVVVLRPVLLVRAQTAWAAEALDRLNPPDEPIPTIPAAAYNVGAALVAEEQGVPVGPPWSRLHLGAGRWLTLRADRMTPSAGSEEGDVVVTLEASTPGQRREVFALASGLSPREREVLAELARGLDSRAIAESLVVSEHTVHDHVKAVLAKTGTTSRQALLSRIAGAA
jgi:DNA-binding CsgD family transcriptional regulator